MKSSNNLKKVSNYRNIGIIGWTVLCLFLFLSMIYSTKYYILTIAKEEANSLWKRDIAYREWNSKMGGVYVTVTKEIIPNPYLKKMGVEYELITKSGKKFALINPAYMIRLVYKIIEKQFGEKAHISSLNPVNPDNIPNEWEKKALQLFKTGQKKEVTNLIEKNGEKYLCLIKPLLIKKSCLKCHSEYSIGDVKGALSIQVPLSKYLSLEKRYMLIYIIGYSIVWLLGLSLILWVSGIIEKDVKQIYAQQKNLNNLSAALDMSDIGILMVDEYFKIIHMNSPLQKWFGDQIGKICYKSIYGLDSPCQICESKSIVKEMKGRTFEIHLSEITNKDGHIVKVELFKDITEKKKEEEKMIQMEKLQSIGILAGGIAHDFNNLLGGILGSVELAKMNSPPGSLVNSYLDMARKELQKATSLTRQLLTFSKGGEPILEVEDISEIIKQVTMFHISGTSIQAHFDLSDDLWQVLVDKGQISQVIANLIINAVQAMPEGGNIFIKAENVKIDKRKGVSLKGNFVKITIKDEGVGIPKEHLNKIFEPYFTTKESGSGLGLSIVASIITKHHGHIDVESKPGIGTTFTIYLPAAISSQKGIKDSTLKQEKKFHSERVLVIDDEEVIRNILKDMLNILGYKYVDSAKNGQEALQKYIEAYKNSVPFDLIIVDLTIPGSIKSKELCKEILRIEPKTKIIIMSGYSESPILTNYKRYGFKGRLIKPFTIEDLKKELSNITI